MMKIAVVSPSLINPRQWMLFEKIGRLNLANVLAIAPSKMYDERGVDITSHNFSLVHLETVGKSFYRMRLRGLGQHIKEFRPDILYAMVEPHTILSGECKKICELLQIPYAVFSWENIENRKFGEPFDSIEEEVIKSADVLIAGNEGAKKRLIAAGGEEEKVKICTQTGIAMDRFRYMQNIERNYDTAYFGRMVEEKGVAIIERVVREHNLKHLWIGARGTFRPEYGNAIGWIPYLQLPEYYNKIKVFVTYPYGYHGYTEQMNYTIGESLACGTPVVTSDNGSISQVYEGAPIIYAIKEGSEKALKEAVSFALVDLENYPREEGIKWVRQHLDNEHVGKKLVKILEGAL